MQKTKRLFVAINVSESITKQFTPFLRKLKIGADHKDMALKWTPIQNYHITLHFIGDRSVEDLQSYKRVLQEVAGNFSAFQLKIEDISAFPSEMSGRVIYLGVQNKKILGELQNDLVHQLEVNGLLKGSADFASAYQRGPSHYEPHLTIARLRNPQNVKDFISPLKRKSFGKIEVNRITLYETQLQGIYPVYIPLAEFDLRGGQQLLATGTY